MKESQGDEAKEQGKRRYAEIQVMVRVTVPLLEKGDDEDYDFVTVFDPEEIRRLIREEVLGVDVGFIDEEAKSIAWDLMDEAVKVFLEGDG